MIFFFFTCFTVGRKAYVYMGRGIAPDKDEEDERGRKREKGEYGCILAKVGSTTCIDSS